MELDQKPETNLQNLTTTPESDGIFNQENSSPLKSEAVQSPPEAVAIAPQKKGIRWYLVKGGILFLILNLGIEGSRYFSPQSNNCCGRPEAPQYVGSMNRAQQAKFAENGTFANSVNELGLGIKTQTNHFKYSVSATKTAAFNYGTSYKDAFKTVYFGLFNWDERIELKSYVGAVFVVPTNGNPNSDQNEMTTISIVCMAVSPSKTQPANPLLKDGEPTCGVGTEKAFK